MTKCIKNRLTFPSCKGRKVEAEFAKEEITSDGGILLLRGIDHQLQLTKKLAKLIPDQRDQSKIIHSLQSMLQQRIYGLALGYEDLNDHTHLRHDPAIQTALDRDDVLASSSTLCRLEGTSTQKILFDANALMVEKFVESYCLAPEQIILDFDATDDRVHGNQENRHFHGYYDSYCFLPLHVFCGTQLLVSYLRPSNIDGAKHAWAILSLLVKRIRQSWPAVKIIFRADSGFCRHKMLRWCEKHDVTYIVGISKNSRLNKLTVTEREMAKTEFEITQEKQRIFTELSYAAKTWKRERRIIAKFEYSSKGENTRYIVTNEKDFSPGFLYADLYCARGEMENRIKEIKCDLFSDRTSCHQWWPNQFRLIESSMAYILIETMRRTALKGTELERAQCGTIRLRLYKIGAIIFRNSRRIKFLFSSNYPKQELFFKTAHRLCPS